MDAQGSIVTPRAQAPLVLVRTKEAYRTWHVCLAHVARVDRNTIGVRIDETFLSLLELVFRACFAADRLEKAATVSGAIAKSDMLKFLLQVAWEGKILNHKRYGELLLDLDEIGRMLGGWKRALVGKTPAR